MKKLFTIFLLVVSAYATKVGKVKVWDGTENVLISSDSAMHTTMVDSPKVQIIPSDTVNVNIPASDTVRTFNVDTLIIKQIDANNELLARDNSTASRVSITYEHHEMHSGSFFYVKNWADVDGSGTHVDFLWVVTDTTKLPHAQWAIDGEAEFTMSLYEAVVVSDSGTPVPVFNANRNSAKTALVEAYITPTLASGALGDASDGGTLVWAGKIGTGKKSTTGRTTSYEFIGKQNTRYWFRITKVAAGTHWLDYDFNWYEHIDRN